MRMWIKNKSTQKALVLLQIRVEIHSKNVARRKKALKNIIYETKQLAYYKNQLQLRILTLILC